MGGIAQLNHPNFHYAADAPSITRLARSGLTLLEIANRSWDSNDVPDDRTRPTTEAIWDAVLTAGVDVFGTATDDAHHYFDADEAETRGEPVFRGDLGFVMVRAEREPVSDSGRPGEGRLLRVHGRAPQAGRSDGGSPGGRGWGRVAGTAPIRVHWRGRAGARACRGPAGVFPARGGPWRVRSRRRHRSAGPPRLGPTDPGSVKRLTRKRLTRGLTRRSLLVGAGVGSALVYARVGWHPQGP